MGGTRHRIPQPATNGQNDPRARPHDLTLLFPPTPPGRRRAAATHAVAKILVCPGGHKPPVKRPSVENPPERFFHVEEGYLLASRGQKVSFSLVLARLRTRLLSRTLASRRLQSLSGPGSLPSERPQFGRNLRNQNRLSRKLGKFRKKENVGYYSVFLNRQTSGRSDGSKLQGAETKALPRSLDR